MPYCALPRVGGAPSAFPGGSGGVRATTIRAAIRCGPTTSCAIGRRREAARAMANQTGGWGFSLKRNLAVRSPDTGAARPGNHQADFARDPREARMARKDRVIAPRRTNRPLSYWRFDIASRTL